MVCWKITISFRWFLPLKAPFLGEFPWKHICWFEHDGLLDILMENTWWTCWEPSSNGIKSYNINFSTFFHRKNPYIFPWQNGIPGWHSLSWNRSYGNVPGLGILTGNEARLWLKWLNESSKAVKHWDFVRISTYFNTQNLTWHIAASKPWIHDIAMEIEEFSHLDMIYIHSGRFSISVSVYWR
jgi:hypothetical protein